MSELQERNSDLKIRHGDLQQKYEDAAVFLEGNEAQVRALEDTVNELRMSSELEREQLRNDVDLLKENLENAIRERNSESSQLRISETELSASNDRCRNLQQSLEDLKAESGGKISELEAANRNLLEELRAKEEEVSRISELLEISGLLRAWPRSNCQSISGS